MYTHMLTFLAWAPLVLIASAMVFMLIRGIYGLRTNGFLKEALVGAIFMVAFIVGVFWTKWAINYLNLF